MTLPAKGMSDLVGAWRRILPPSANDPILPRSGGRTDRIIPACAGEHLSRGRPVALPAPLQCRPCALAPAVHSGSGPEVDTCGGGMGRVRLDPVAEAHFAVLADP